MEALDDRRDGEGGTSNVAADMLGLAEQTARDAKQGGVVLDYSVGSLSAFDRMIEHLRSKLTGRADPMIAMMFGAVLSN